MVPIRKSVRCLDIGLLSVSLAALFLVLVFHDGLKSKTVGIYQGIPKSVFLHRSPARLATIEVDIAPEALQSLDNEIPKNPGCVNVPYSWIPVHRIVVNGRTLSGRYQARYRGFCKSHWYYGQKSIKIARITGEWIDGYQEIALNSFATDAEFFDIWASQLYHATGGVAARVGFVHFVLNGKYNGLRSFVENIDLDLLENQKLPKGPIYREVEHANFGGNPERLKHDWKKNSLKNEPWTDWIALNRAIADSVREKNDQYLEYLNVDHVVHYYAFLNLVGTAHANDHNIPMYRPNSDAGFIPIVYDLAGNYMGGYSEHFREAQIPLMSFNLLSGLIMSNDDLRLRIHKRIAWLLERVPDLRNSRRKLFEEMKQTLFDSKEKSHGLMLDHPAYRDKKRYLSTLDKEFRLSENRFDVLNQKYFSPVARINKDWNKQNSFQMTIDGYGPYELKLTLNQTQCDPKQQEAARFRFHISGWRKLASCIDGQWKAAPLIVERNDIERPPYVGAPYLDMDMNSIGPVWIEFDRVPSKLIRNIQVVSRTTGREVRLNEDWPFFFKSIKPGVIDLGVSERARVHDYSQLDRIRGFSIVDLSKGQSFLKMKNSRLTIPRYFKQEGTHHFNTFAPLLCYNFDAVRDCFEFNRTFLTVNQFTSESYFDVPPEIPVYRMPFEKFPQLRLSSLNNKKLTPPSILAQRLAQNEVTNCEKFEFVRGLYVITTPVRFPAKCRVIFKSGSVIAMGMDGALSIEGPVQFPQRPPFVVFKSSRETEGGGVIIRKSAGPVIVRNAIFAQSRDFYLDGTRYQGALNLIDVASYRVENNIFLDNDGDDGLNVSGGKGVIFRNVFTGNHDAIDVDGGFSEIRSNLILDAKDDGIHAGKTSTVFAHDNLIQKMGDKGFAVSAGAKVTLTDNVITKGKVGLGIRNGSNVSLDGNWITMNGIGIDIYDQVSTSLKQTEALVGRSQITNNLISFRVNARNSTSPLKAQLLGPAEAKLSAINDSCQICKSEAGPEIMKTVL